MKILIADDDAVSRLYLGRMLERNGFHVVTVSDGAKAVDMLSREDGPRLVLLDWSMPGLSGPQVCSALRSGSRSAYVYITLLTSRDSKEDLIAGLGAGADDYLTKPCHPEELQARLRTGQRIIQLEDILIQAREDMRLQASRDGMTQLLNRAAIMEEVSNRIGSSRLGESGFSLLLCDVDRFKNVNDTYGHSVGDSVLCEVASRLANAVSDGVVGRYGGEEFLLLMDGCGKKDLTRVASGISDAVRALPVQTSAGPLQITVSGGAVHVPLGSRIVAAEIVRRADELLYMAKKAGRDRVLVASNDDALVYAD